MDVAGECRALALAVDMALLLGAALAGAFVATRFEIPLAALMGALTGTVLAQGLGLISLEPAPPVVRNVLYSAVGLMIGLRITRSSLHKLRGVALPAIMVPAMMILSGVLLGLLYAALAPDDSGLRLDLKTAVLSITPGGFQEMAIAAQQMNALIPVVVVTHMVRIMTVLYTYPKIVHALVRRAGDGRTEEGEDSAQKSRTEDPRKEQAGAGQWLAMAAGAATGGAFGVWSGVPAGAVVFAMLGAAVVKGVIGADSATLPRFGRLGIQVSLGIVLGLQFSLGPLARAGSLIVPLAIALVLLIALSVGTGLLIWYTTPTDLATALWMSAPGGLMEVAVMADAMKVDVLPVLTVHIMRVVLIITIQPSLVLVLSRWL